MTPGTLKAALFSLAVAALSVTFLLAELAARYQVDAWPFETPMVAPPHLSAREASLRWRFSASDGRNSLGLRNREIGAKSPQDFRILFLGDSLVWTGETSNGELYTEVIERSLNRTVRRPAGRVEVINAGIPGYTTYQELEFLKLHGLDMEPDLVVLGFVFNDLYYPYLHKPTAGKMLDMDPGIRLNRMDSRGFPGWFFARSYAAHQMSFVMQRALWKLTGHPYFPFERRDDFYLAWTPHGWSTTESLLGEMRDQLARQGRKFVVVIFPVIDQVDDAYRALDLGHVLYPQRRIGAICAALAVACLDLTQSLHAAGGKALYRDYLHLNAKGNDLVASDITQFLQTDPVLNPAD